MDYKITLTNGIVFTARNADLNADMVTQYLNSDNQFINFADVIINKRMIDLITPVQDEPSAD
ncbi:MAG TPA: hypothetical protein VIR26_01260 [Metalysinibacillus sp.]